MGLTLNRRSLNDWLAGLQRGVLACCAILLLSACLDGYTTEDELIVTPLEMTQMQRLQAMNQLGQEAHPELTWLYRAMPGCSLHWTVQGGDAGKETGYVPLRGAGIDLRSDKEEQTYGVQVRPAEASEVDELTVLLSKKWVDAIEMSQLVRWFQIGCTASSATVPPGNSNPS